MNSKSQSNRIDDFAGTHTARRVLGYLPQLLGHAFRTFPLARVTLLLALLSVVLEYATLSLMVPLVGRSSTSTVSQWLVALWGSVADALGYAREQRTWLWLFVLLFGLRIVAGYLHITLNVFVSKRVHAHLSDKIFKRVVIEEPLATIFRRTIGYYISLAGDETHKAGSIFFYFGQMLTAALSAVAGLAVLLVFSPAAFWLTTVFLLVTALVLAQCMRKILQLSSLSLGLSRALNTNFVEALNGLRSVRSLSAEQFVVGTYRGQIKKYVRALFLIEALNQGCKAAPALVLVAAGVVWLWPGESAVQGGTTLFFFAVTTMLIRTLAALGEVVTTGGKLVADVRASQDAFELFTKANRIDASGGTVKLNEQITAISLHDVAAGYEQKDPVFRRASIDLAAGKSYALIGKSGAGKSTLADVLLGLLPISGGQILVNGIPFATIDRSSLRSRVVLVEQQTRVFTGPLRDNVTMGLHATDDAVHTALRNAGLADFVTELPAGLATVLDYQGANLSGGQRQRIGIARALIRRPDVLILDEATNSVDPILRRTLARMLCEQFSQRILVFITHDHEVLAVTDEVWRVEEGALEQETPASAGSRENTGRLR